MGPASPRQVGGDGNAQTVLMLGCGCSLEDAQDPCEGTKLECSEFAKEDPPEAVRSLPGTRHPPPAAVLRLSKRLKVVEHSL